METRAELYSTIAAYAKYAKPKNDKVDPRWNRTPTSFDALLDTLIGFNGSKFNFKYIDIEDVNGKLSLLESESGRGRFRTLFQGDEDEFLACLFFLNNAYIRHGGNGVHFRWHYLDKRFFGEKNVKYVALRLLELLDELQFMQYELHGKSPLRDGVLDVLAVLGPALNDVLSSDVSSRIDRCIVVCKDAAQSIAEIYESWSKELEECAA